MRRSFFFIFVAALALAVWLRPGGVSVAAALTFEPVQSALRATGAIDRGLAQSSLRAILNVSLWTCLVAWLAVPKPQRVSPIWHE